MLFLAHQEPSLYIFEFWLYIISGLVLLFSRVGGGWQVEGSCS